MQEFTVNIAADMAEANRGEFASEAEVERVLGTYLRRF